MRAIGQFAWNTTTGDWYWDAGMFEIHGYPHDAVCVDTDLVLSHKQGNYRAYAAKLLSASASADQRFSNYHKILDVDGQQRTVLVVGESRADLSRPTKPQRLARGFMVDVTRDDNDSTQRGVLMARQGAAAIQQSTGLLMGSLGLSEEAAFAVLRRVSSHHNVKVRDLTRRFMAAAVSSSADSPRDLSQLLIEQAEALAVERAAGADTGGA